VVFLLILAVVAMLGLVWVSIAVAGLLALELSPPLAAAITGGAMIATTALTFLLSRAVCVNAEPDVAAVSSSTGQDLISRATGISERMAPDWPMFAIVFALLAGLASVSVPSTLNPFLNKILDDLEKFPVNQRHN